MRITSPFKRKNAVQRFADTISDQLDAVSSATSSAAMKSRKAARTGLLAAGGIAGLTAGSAAISSLRHRADRNRSAS